jgi:hypothetical protein
MPAVLIREPTVDCEVSVPLTAQDVQFSTDEELKTHIDRLRHKGPVSLLVFHRALTRLVFIVPQQCFRGRQSRLAVNLTESERVFLLIRKFSR